MDADARCRGECAGDGSGGATPGGICVEQEEDGVGASEPAGLLVGQGGSEQGDGWRGGCLFESHDGPWTLDEDEAAAGAGRGSVGVVEHVGLGEFLGEAPLSEAVDVVGVESAAAISEGFSLQVVQADGDGGAQEGAARGAAGLESGGGGGRDALVVLKEGDVWVERDGATEGAERGAGAGGGRGQGGRGGVELAGRGL